jgi:hypothetical protein
MERIRNKGLVYEFGKFALDPGGKTLVSGGKPIHLPAPEGDPLLGYIRFFARYDFVRDDPGFQAVVQKTGC